MTDDVNTLLSDGYRAHQSGDLTHAEDHYARVLQLEPNNLHALNLLGMLCANAQRPAEAVELISQALKIKMDDPQAHGNIGLAYKDLGKLPKSIHHLKESIALKSDNAVVHNNLGNVLRLLDQPEEAVQSYRRALDLDPNFAECWSNVAAGLNESDQPEAALEAVSRALVLNPKLAQAYNNQGDIYLVQARYEDALDSYRTATQLSPKYVAALINMAKVQRDMDAPDDAMATLSKAIEIEPNNPEASHVMGVLWEQIGDRDKAAQSFRAAIATAPEMTVAHYHLAQIKGRVSTDDELAAMQKLWTDETLPENARMYLAFGLSRAYEHREQLDKAFEYLAKGNRIKADAKPYDDEETQRYLDSIAAATSRAKARLGEKAGLDDSRPVFVLGMPRSGTSLTEQILASHSRIAGAGELSYAYDMVHRIRDMTREVFPENLDVITASQLEGLGQYYLSRHSAHNLSAQYVVDKTPLNFQYLGVLALALPNAKFVHCHRDPVANCFAIHRMPFDLKQTYAHDLTALGRYYSRYWRLMRHWRGLFGERILSVRYEDTVADIEGQSRRLLDFLGLPFEPGVLEFYKTRRLVKTPSASQVREPIYRDSVAAWKRFERQLEPLIANLEVAGDG